MATTEEIVADLFRDNVPYALSLNQRLAALFLSAGVSAAYVNDNFRDGVTYETSINHRIVTALQAAGADEAAVAEYFRDFVPYSISLNHRIAAVFGFAFEVTLDALFGNFFLTSESLPGEVAGTLAGTTPDSILSLIDNASNQVALSGLNILAGLGTLTAGNHSFTVRETHSLADNSPRDTVLTLEVSFVDSSRSLDFSQAANSQYFPLLFIW